MTRNGSCPGQVAAVAVTKNHLKETFATPDIVNDPPEPRDGVQDAAHRRLCLCRHCRARGIVVPQSSCIPIAVTFVLQRS